MAGFFDGGGAGVLGGIINAISGHNTNQDAKGEAQKNRNFQDYQSNTAHQREVADMKAAGLNPILSATGGSGASTSSGSMPSMTAPEVNMPDFLAYGISLKQLEQADAKIGIDRDLADSAISKNTTEKDLNRVKTQLGQRGMPRALLEGEAADVLRKGIKYLKDSVKKQNYPVPLESSGGNLP